jgi:hypothetical protein
LELKFDHEYDDNAMRNRVTRKRGKKNSNNKDDIAPSSSGTAINGISSVLGSMPTDHLNSEELLEGMLLDQDELIEL